MKLLLNKILFQLDELLIGHKDELVGKYLICRRCGAVKELSAPFK